LFGNAVRRTLPLLLLVLESEQQADRGSVTGPGVPPGVTLPAPLTRRTVPVMVTGSRARRLRSPRQVGRTKRMLHLPDFHRMQFAPEEA
jgi:hypothetical protein